MESAFYDFLKNIPIPLFPTDIGSKNIPTVSPQFSKTSDRPPTRFVSKTNKRKYCCVYVPLPTCANYKEPFVPQH